MCYAYAKQVWKMFFSPYVFDFHKAIFIVTLSKSSLIFSRFESVSAGARRSARGKNIQHVWTQDAHE